MHKVIYSCRNYWQRKPALCVVITNYDYAHYILDCLESVSSQTIPKLDLIIVDDFSRDNSLEIIKNWLIKNRKRFRKIDLIAQHKNRGPANSRNLGIRTTECKYCFMLDADNILMPDCLAKLEEALEYSDASFSYPIVSKFGDLQVCLNHFPWNPQKLKHGNYIDTLSLIRRSFLLKIGLYTENESTRLGWEDYDLWIKIAMQQGTGILVPQILANYRVHSNSRSFKTQNPNSEFLRDSLRNTYPDFWKMDFEV